MGKLSILRSFSLFSLLLTCRASKSLGSKNYCLVGRLTLESSVVLHSGQREGGKIIKFDVFSFLKFSFSEKATKICAFILMVLTYTK